MEDLWKICGRFGRPVQGRKEKRKVSGRFFRSYEWAYTDESFYVTWCCIQQWSFGHRDDLYSMLGPIGPPVTYGPVRPMGASGPGVDPPQGSGDPSGRGQQENSGLSFAPVSSATGSDGSKIICNLADRAVCPTEHSCEYSDLWSATWVFGCKWTDCQWGSCATCSIQHGPNGFADDETADAFDSEYYGLYDEVSTEYCTTNAWSTSASSSGQGASSGSAPCEKLTMDTKWIPAAPLPDWKSWSNRARELSGFKGWLEKFTLWLCLVHDSYAAELKEALDLP